MSTTQRQNVIKDFKAKPKGKGKDGSSSAKGPDWRTPNETGAAMTQLVGLKGMANDAKSGTKFKPGPRDRPGTGQRLDRGAAAQKILKFTGAKLKDPVLVTAALDAAYDGHLSAETVRRLITAGFKPSQVAKTLGVPTSGAYRGSRPGLIDAARRPGVKPLSPNPPSSR